MPKKPIIAKHKKQPTAFIRQKLRGSTKPVSKKRKGERTMNKKAYEEGYEAGVRQAMLDTGLIKLSDDKEASPVEKVLERARRMAESANNQTS